MSNVVGDAAKSARAGFLGAMLGELRWVCAVLAILDDLEMARRHIWRTCTSP